MTTDLDLVVLVAGKDEWETIDGLLRARCQSIGIRPLRHRLLVHPRRDPGCFMDAPAVLQTFQDLASHALVMFDHEGSGQEARSADDLEADLKERLSRSGWMDRAAVLVMVPELESWVWSDSPHVDDILGWHGATEPLRHWLKKERFLLEGQTKPERPKEAMRAALRKGNLRPSSAIFRALAESVGLERCTDPSFKTFKELLKQWFPPREENAG